MAWKLPSLVEGVTKLTKAWVEELVKKEEESAQLELATKVSKAEAEAIATAAAQKVEPESAYIVATAEIATLSGVPSSTLTDNITMSVGQRILLTNQANPVNNGLWIVESSAWKRPPGFATKTIQPIGTYVSIVAGTSEHAASIWVLANSTAVEVDVSAQSWEPNSPGSGVITKAEVEKWAKEAAAGQEGVNPDLHGAKGDCRVLAGGKITSGKAILTFTSAAFTSADVGKTINVEGAVSAEAWSKEKVKGPYPQTLVTTIKAVKSATEVELSANASKTTTTAVVVYGTDNTAAFVAAIKVLEEAGGGQLQLTRGANYGVLPSTTQAFKVPANVIVEGYGAIITAFCAGASEAYAEAKAHENEYSGGFVPAGTSGIGYVTVVSVVAGIVRFKGVTFWKMPAAEKISAMAIGGTATEVSFEDCRWLNGFGYTAEVSVACRVVMDRCEVEGVKVKTINPFGSMGILFDYTGESVSSGGELIVTDTYFHGNGLEECIHDHCLYIYSGVSYDIKGCTFNHHGNGRYILGGYAGASAENSAAFCQVENCLFGKDTECTIGAIQTNPHNTTTYVNCTFNMPKKAVQLEGNSIFTNCVFPHGETATWPLIQPGEVSAAVTASFIGCRFRTEGASAGSVGNECVIEANTPGATLKETSIKLIACEFTGVPESAFVLCLPHDENDVIKVEATNCGFAGYSGKTTVAFQAQTGGTSTKSLMRIIGCRFDSTLTSAVNKNGGTVEATLIGNELNQSGPTIENAPISAMREWGSYGSKGSLSQGVASFSGETAKTITTSAATTSSHILLTILGAKPKQTVCVKERKAGSFVIELGGSDTVEVAWAIVT